MKSHHNLVPTKGTDARKVLDRLYEMQVAGTDGHLYGPLSEDSLVQVTGIGDRGVELATRLLFRRGLVSRTRERGREDKFAIKPHVVSSLQIADAKATKAAAK